MKKSAKRGRGRPPESSESRDKVVILRVAQGEKDQWSKAATRAGLSLSQWVREALDNAAKR